MDNFLTACHITAAFALQFFSCGAQPPPPLFYLTQYHSSQSYYIVLFSLPEVYFLHFWSCTFYMSPYIRIPCFIFDYLQLESTYERLCGRLSYLCISLVQASALLVCTLPIPQWHWTIAEMSASAWTSSASVQTFGAIIHPNSEYMAKANQRLCTQTREMFCCHCRH